MTDEPDLDRAARSVVDENGVWLYHENVGPTENGVWVKAKDLREGDVFLGANGELSTLASSERIEFPEGIKVYNFTVEGNHDYFVIAETGEYGQTSILVHNGVCNRPGWNSLRVEIGHILSGHKIGGERIRPNSVKDLFPYGWSDRDIMKSVKKAYLTGKVVKTQKLLDSIKGPVHSLKIHGNANGLQIEIWVDVLRNKLTSAYPINK